MTSPQHKTPPPASAPDMLFGRLVVKAGYLTDTQVEALLKEQRESSRAGATVSLGEICQMKKLLTSQQVQRVLLAQRYTEIREEDKRIGALAVKNGFASEEEIRLALGEQEKLYRAEKKLPNRLGDILVEAEVLTPQQLDALLAAQTRLREKPRPPTAGAEATARAQPAPARADAPTPPASEPSGWLIQEAGEGAGRHIALDARALIGRQPENEVPIADIAASRQHARIEFDARAKRHVLSDLNSRNGTLLNGAPVKEAAPLKNGDRIQIGETVLRYVPGAGVDAAFKFPGETVIVPSLRLGPQGDYDTAEVLPTVKPFASRSASAAPAPPAPHPPKQSPAPAHAAPVPRADGNAVSPAEEIEGEVVGAGDEIEGEVVAGEAALEGKVVSAGAELEGEVVESQGSPEAELEGEIIEGEIETPPTEKTTAGSSRRSLAAASSRARFQRLASARRAPSIAPERGGKKGVVIIAVVLALAAGGWFLKDKWMSKETATGVAGEARADKSGAQASPPAVGTDAEQPPQKAASEDRVDVAKLKMPPPSDMVKIDVDQLLPLPKVDPPDVTARLEEIRKTWRTASSTAKKVYTCVGCQKKVTGTPGTTAKCPYCAKLLKFPVESTFSSSLFSEVEQRLLEMEARDIEKRWPEAVKSDTHAWVFKPFRTQHGVPNREWETVADLFDKLNEDIKRYLAPVEMRRRDALEAAPSIEAKDLLLPLPSELVKIDIEKTLPLPQEKKLDFDARIIGIRSLWQTAGQAKTAYTCPGCKKQVEALPGTTGTCPSCGKSLKFSGGGAKASRKPPFTEQDVENWEKEVENTTYFWNLAHTSTSEGDRVWRWGPIRNRYSLTHPEEEKIADEFDRLNKDIEEFLAAGLKRKQVMAHREALSEALRQFKATVDEWNSRVEAATKGHGTFESLLEDLSRIKSDLTPPDEPSVFFPGSNEGPVGLRTHYGPLVTERLSHLEKVVRQQQVADRERRREEEAARDRRRLERARAMADNPLKAWVQLNKKSAARWQLIIGNFSEREWTNVVFTIESTAHGGGFRLDAGSIKPSGAGGGSRFAECFDFQTYEGTRFNSLFMQIKSVNIKCSQGEATVIPRPNWPGD